MPDDEHESDDLFEDLDKFFAPIKDVDWDEPEERPRSGPPTSTTGEEHVTVRGEPERGRDRAPRGRPMPGDAPPCSRTTTTRIERLVRHGIARARRPGARGSRRSSEDEDDEPLVGAPAEMERPDDDQADLFARRRRGRRDVDRTVRPGRGRQEGDRPSDAELEEAAAHFSDSCG